MEKYLTKIKPQIASTLKNFLHSQQSDFKIVSAWDPNVLKRLEVFSESGKMIRGALVVLAAEMFGRKPDQEIIKCAAAIELFHSGLLIQDDIMDRDQFRRGQPTLSYQYQKIAGEQNLKNPSRLGTSLALCLSDVCFFTAYAIFSELKIETLLKTKLLKLLSLELVRVSLGQMLDVTNTVAPISVDKTEILRVYRYKTCRYTFSLPLVLGASLAGVNPQLVVQLEKLGEALGLIFQVKDDELGLFGQKERIGKPTGSDLKEGKQTLYWFYLWRQATPEEKQKLQKIFGNPGLTAKNIVYFQKLMHKYKIGQILQTEIEKQESQAKKIISKLSLSGHYQKLMMNLLQYLKFRKQ